MDLKHLLCQGVKIKRKVSDMTLQRNETITKKTMSKDFKERMRAKERGQEQENSNYVV
jgi:hypothetical protein